MRLVVDCRAVHRHMGGIGCAALELARCLSAATCGHRVSVVVGSDPPDSLRLDGADVQQVEAAMIDEPFEQFGLPGVLEDSS